MSRPVLEVADILRDHGAAWRKANAGHVSLDPWRLSDAGPDARGKSYMAGIRNPAHCTLGDLADVNRY
jgi:hypothetical protein